MSKNRNVPSILQANTYFDDKHTFTTGDPMNISHMFLIGVFDGQQVTLHNGPNVVLTVAFNI